MWAQRGLFFSVFY